MQPAFLFLTVVNAYYQSNSKLNFAANNTV